MLVADQLKSLRRSLSIRSSRSARRRPLSRLKLQAERLEVRAVPNDSLGGIIGIGLLEETLAKAVESPPEQNLLSSEHSEESTRSIGLTEELNEGDLDALFAAIERKSEQSPPIKRGPGDVRDSAFVGDTASPDVAAITGDSPLQPLTPDILDDLLHPLLDDAYWHRQAASQTGLRLADVYAIERSTAGSQQTGSSSASLPSPRPHGFIMPVRTAPGSGSFSDSGLGGSAKDPVWTTADIRALRATHPDAVPEHHFDMERLAGSSSSSSGGRPSVTITGDSDANEAPTTSGQFTILRADSGGTTDLPVHFIVGGTATEGGDYLAIGTTRTIPAGQPSVTISIDPTDDTTWEGSESVIVKLLPDQSGEDYTLGSPDISDRVIIFDNECSGGACPSPGLELELAEVHAKRTSPVAIAEPLTEVKSGGHFDVGSTFQFELVAAHGDTTNISWELWEQDPLNPDDLLASGSGTSFSKTFGAEHDGADPYVRFYDSGSGNDVSSNVFLVQLMTPYDIHADVSSKISGVTDSDVWDVFDGASNLLVRKDSEYDWRATVALRPMTITTFTVSADRPDPVEDRTSEYEKHFDAAADVVFVDDLKKPGLVGVTGNNEWQRIIIEWGNHPNALRSVVLAHEFGHGVRLEHSGHVDPDLLDTTISTDNVELNRDDVDNYE